MRNVILKLGFFEIWINQGVGYVNQLLAVLRQRLKVQDWFNALENSSRARYNRNASGFYLQSYLAFITIRKFRIAMIKLRVFSHRLDVETGR